MARHPQDLDFVHAFGERVRAVRQAGGVTQQRLADLLDVRPSTISEIERGRKSATLSTVAALAEALGVGVAELFETGPPAAGSTETAEEKELLALYRALDPEARVLLRGVGRRMRTEG